MAVLDRFDGVTVLVTGAAQGIGAAIARRFATEGAGVVLLDIAPEVEQTAEQLRAVGGRAVAVRGDVSDPGSWSDAVSAAHDAFGPVGVLVPNAYAKEVAPAHETSRASWDHQLAVNLTGTFLGVQACLPDLRTTQGAVVITSSVHAQVGLPGHPAYAATKGGLTALTRQLAVEYGPEIRVNCVLPGPILTAAWDDIPEEDRRQSADQTVTRRLGRPEEVAAAVAFLSSNDATYITGTSLPVDGGWTIYKTSR